jgi:outer membrane protein OmpA-like peptidoglycan-associated protein
MTQFDIPWQQPETMAATTELFGESPFEATQFGAVDSHEFLGTPAESGVSTEGLLPAYGQVPTVPTDEVSAGFSSYIAPVSSYGEGETTISESDPARGAGEGEQWMEQQAPPLVAPTPNSVFPPDAVRLLPDVLQATPLVQLTSTVPTQQVLVFIGNGRRNPGAEPGWSDRLLVGLVDLPKAAPITTVHVFVVKTIPFNVNEKDKQEAFQRFARRMNHVRETAFDVTTVATYDLNRAVDELFFWPAASIATAAGLPARPTVQETANYKIVIHLVLPDRVGRVVMPRNYRVLPGFAFDKITLTAEHERTLQWLAWEVVRSWYSRSRVIRIVVDGHTDPVGTATYNKALGLRRAKAVTERLKQLVNKMAGRLPAGTVERIEYVVRSFGAERPISRRLQSLNRRVEITLSRDMSPPPTPLDLDLTVTRLEQLLTHSTFDSDAVSRMRCLLKKVRDPGTDDRFFNDTQVFFVNRDNAKPGPTEWNRVRTRLLHPDLFAPSLPDKQVLDNIGRIDEEIIYGVSKMTQMIDYASGADYGLGLYATANALKDLNKWLLARLDDPKSVYSCYPQLRP